MKTVIHPSQSPAQVEAERAECIRQRSISAKFHYETDRQAALWLKLHEHYAFAGAMAQPYAEAAKVLASSWPHSDGTLIALGCGGGEKDISILKALPTGTRFVPTDVSKPLVLKAAQTALEVNPSSVITPLVFDLATADNLPEFIDQHAGPNRIYTFFGIIPNFPPCVILPRLRMLLHHEDRLLLSANLAPDGTVPILPQYDNDTTREWLAEFPKAYGAGQGDVTITIETDDHLQRIAAHYHFQEPCVMKVNGERFEFGPDDSLQLFVSYRYTLKSLTDTLEPHGIAIENTFLNTNGEEGVFLCGLQ